jgi:hypothetical protein
MKNKIKKLILNWLFGTDNVDSYMELLHENIDYHKKYYELTERCAELIDDHIKTLDKEKEMISILRKLVQVCENHGIDAYEEVKNIKL